MSDSLKRDVTRFTLSAVLKAVGVVGCVFVVCWQFGLLCGALVVVMVITSRIVATRNADQRLQTNREWTAFDRILLGIAGGGLTGIVYALLHAALHSPRRVPSDPLANEWWTVGVVIAALSSAFLGILIGIVLAAADRRVRMLSSGAAIAGAAVGLLIGLLPRTADPAASLFMGCLFSAFSAVIAICTSRVVGCRLTGYPQQNR